MTDTQRIFLAVIGAAALVIVVVIVGLVTVQRDIRADRLESQRVGCDRSQVQRGLERVVVAPSDHAKLFNAYNRILDCDKTYSDERNGRAVYMSRDVERCFLKLVGDGYFLKAEPTTEEKAVLREC